MAVGSPTAVAAAGRATIPVLRVRVTLDKAEHLGATTNCALTLKNVDAVCKQCVCGSVDGAAAAVQCSAARRRRRRGSGATRRTMAAAAAGGSTSHRPSTTDETQRVQPSFPSSCISCRPHCVPLPVCDRMALIAVQRHRPRDRRSQISQTQTVRFPSHHHTPLHSLRTQHEHVHSHAHADRRE